MTYRLLPPPLDFAAFRRENTVLILLNLGVMLGLLALHFVFRPVLGALSLAGALALGARFLMQLGELAILSNPGFSLGHAGTRAYAWFTVVAHMVFASLLSRISTGQESHHVVLLVIPVIASAFWFSLPGLVLTVGGAGLLTILQVWVPVGVLPQGKLMEYFEATTVALIFILVAAVVRFLARRLWNRERELKTSLAELDTARDQLVREEKLAAIGRLSSAIAHEIRNPVAMISSSVIAATKEGAPESVRSECLGIVAMESRRLERLTQDFLTYARNRPLERRRIDLPVVTGAAAGLARAKAEEKGVSLDLKTAREGQASLDPFQIQQALLNLLTNALEASEAGGQVTLGGEIREGTARLWVEDDGSPVPQSITDHLGEPFHSTKAAGTGLGLAIVHAIAQAHGGTLALEENRPGKVRFALTLPQDAGGSAP
jgi:signal transduction histidine kinase